MKVLLVIGLATVLAVGCGSNHARVSCSRQAASTFAARDIAARGGGPLTDLSVRLEPWGPGRLYAAVADSGEQVAFGTLACQPMVGWRWTEPPQS
jgi:hypothetical protein